MTLICTPRPTAWCICCSCDFHSSMNEFPNLCFYIVNFTFKKFLENSEPPYRAGPVCIAHPAHHITMLPFGNDKIFKFHQCSKRNRWQFCSNSNIMHRAFSVLTLIAGWQEENLAHKNSVMRCWWVYLSGAKCRQTYGPADATATHHLLLH